MAKRRYDSTLRAEKAEQTRLRLLDATGELLVEEGVEALSIPKVARRAAVSAPTAYKNFPTVDDLLSAHLEHIRPQLGLTDRDFGEIAPSNAHELPARTYRSFERQGALMRAVMDSPTFNRVRIAARSNRAGLVLDQFRDEATELSDRDLRAALGAVFMHATPTSWRWLREAWGLSARDASRAATWAMSVLVRELRANPDSIDSIPMEEEE